MKRLMAIISAYAPEGDEDDLMKLFRGPVRVTLRNNEGDMVMLEAGRVDALEWAETVREEARP